MGGVTHHETDGWFQRVRPQRHAPHQYQPADYRFACRRGVAGGHSGYRYRADARPRPRSWKPKAWSIATFSRAAPPVTSVSAPTCWARPTALPKHPSGRPPSAESMPRYPAPTGTQYGLYAHADYRRLVFTARTKRRTTLLDGGYARGHARADRPARWWHRLRLRRDRRVGISVKRLEGLTFPQGENPVKDFIPVARIADMLLNPGRAV